MMKNKGNVENAPPKKLAQEVVLRQQKKLVRPAGVEEVPTGAEREVVTWLEGERSVELKPVMQKIDRPAEFKDVVVEVPVYPVETGPAAKRERHEFASAADQAEYLRSLK